jgi:leucine dehydrogenase
MICHDGRVGLRAVIVIDDTRLGPGLGGIRLASYATWELAARECARLAAGMTRKNAIAGLPYGGAKAVILAPLGGDRTAALRRFGEFVARTAGAYVPGVDMGTTVEDLALVAEAGGAVSCADVDPSPWTAAGVWAAIRSAVETIDGREGLEGIRVVIQGAGHVGAALARDLVRDGATVLLADVDADRVRSVAEAVGAEVIDPEGALETSCDVLAPCAKAGVINHEIVGRLRCRMVVGAANDVLADDVVAEKLDALAITYVPDYVANAGGVIQIHGEECGADEDEITRNVLKIGDRVRDLLTRARAEKRSPLHVAAQRVDELLAAHPAEPAHA